MIIFCFLLFAAYTCGTILEPLNSKIKCFLLRNLAGTVVTNDDGVFVGVDVRHSTPQTERAV